VDRLSPFAGELELSTDPDRLDRDRVHRWLSAETYWAAGRPREVVERSIAGSLVFGVYAPSGQVAFARAVTDGTTFAWVCDVFVDTSVRGRGVGSALVDAVVEHLSSLGIYRILLATRDAHEVYARSGFTPLANPSQWMERDTRAAVSARE
jgi:GNAT superfamily N-acetyltransferase